MNVWFSDKSNSSECEIRIRDVEMKNIQTFEYMGFFFIIR